MFAPRSEPLLVIPQSTSPPFTISYLFGNTQIYHQDCWESQYWVINALVDYLAPSFFPLLPKLGSFQVLQQEELVIALRNGFGDFRVSSLVENRLSVDWDVKWRGNVECFRSWVFV